MTKREEIRTTFYNNWEIWWVELHTIGLRFND